MMIHLPLQVGLLILQHYFGDKFGRVQHAENKTFKVTWNYISQTTFMYGSKVSFSNGEVTFINPLMPSGLPIHEWLMLKQFSKYKSAPSLPILRRGQHYKLHFDFDATPAGSVYFIIIFIIKWHKTKY